MKWLYLLIKDKLINFFNRNRHKRLVIYTDLNDNPIITTRKLKNPDQTQYYMLKIPQGSVTLHRHSLIDRSRSEYTEIFCEVGKERLIYSHNVIPKAFQTWSIHDASYT